jgi:hypothetical protein
MRSEGDKAENRELGVAEQPGCKVLAGRSPGCELGYRGVGTSPMSRVPRDRENSVFDRSGFHRQWLGPRCRRAEASEFDRDGLMDGGAGGRRHRRAPPSSNGIRRASRTGPAPHPAAAVVVIAQVVDERLAGECVQLERLACFDERFPHDAAIKGSLVLALEAHQPLDPRLACRLVAHVDLSTLRLGSSPSRPRPAPSTESLSWAGTSRQTMRRWQAGWEGMDQQIGPTMVLSADRAAIVWTCGPDWAKMTVSACRGGRHGR